MREKGGTIVYYTPFGKRRREETPFTSGSRKKGAEMTLGYQLYRGENKKKKKKSLRRRNHRHSRRRGKGDPKQGHRHALDSPIVKSEEKRKKTRCRDIREKKKRDSKEDSPITCGTKKGGGSAILLSLKRGGDWAFETKLPHILSTV